MRSLKTLPLPLGFAVWTALAATALGTPGQINYSVTFDDTLGAFSATTRQAVESQVKAAGAAWDAATLGTANIEVVVAAAYDIPRATGASVTSFLTRVDDETPIYDQGMASEIITGEDPNEGEPDVLFRISPDYALNELWFDPNPFTRTAAVPANRTDAMTVFLHEFGHALGFNGWADGVTGLLPTTGEYEYASTWDAWIEPIGNDIYFTGPNAVEAHGGPVAVTYGNPSHLGNASPRPGSDLIGDLMNGVVFNRGTRYDISPLDRAILEDIGLSVAPLVTGDYDSNGLVTAGDLGVWQTHYGVTGVNAGDGNNDGVVNAADYTVWRDAMNDLANAASTPEPTTLFLTLAGLLFVARRPAAHAS